jgi:hypothetical protein
LLLLARLFDFAAMGVMAIQISYLTGLRRLNYVAMQQIKRLLMNRLLTSMLAALMLAFSGLSAAADDSPVLTQAELGKLFPGRFQAVVSGAVVVQITARGRWSVKSGKLCIVWSNWLNGKASCSRVIADDGWYRGNGVKFRKI